MISRISHTDLHHEIEAGVARVLESQPGFLSPRTAASPRAAGDAIQAILSDEFESLIKPYCSQYSAQFARRAMADFAFTDVDGLYYAVDVKTHRSGTSFNMPNLTSVDRLTRFYQDDRNYFAVLTVRYAVRAEGVSVEQVHFVPIEFLSWECLTIGALGWGQIQIANASIIKVNDGYSRKEWMLQLCDTMLAFYPREIAKIETRMSRFREARQYWEGKGES